MVETKSSGRLRIASPHRDDAIDGRAVGELAGRVDAGALVVGAPRAHGVEVLERKAERVHHLVTARAHRIRAMLLHALAHGPGLLALVLERRHVGWRRRRRRAEQVLENPFAAQHRRGALGVRRDRQDAAVPEQPLSGLVGDRHAAKTAAVDVRNAVVPRQPLVDERVVGAQQIEDAAILAR